MSRYEKPPLGWRPSEGEFGLSMASRQRNGNTRRPPYSRSVRAGMRDLRAFVGNWEGAKASAAAGRATVLLPPDSDPGAHDWSCCAGADVWLRWRTHEADADTVHRLAVAIVQAGAALVLTCETTGAADCPMQSYRPREVRHAA